MLTEDDQLNTNSKLSKSAVRINEQVIEILPQHCMSIKKRACLEFDKHVKAVAVTGIRIHCSLLCNPFAVAVIIYSSTKSCTS